MLNTIFKLEEKGKINVKIHQKISNVEIKHTLFFFVFLSLSPYLSLSLSSLLLCLSLSLFKKYLNSPKIKNCQNKSANIHLEIKHTFSFSLSLSFSSFTLSRSLSLSHTHCLSLSDNISLSNIKEIMKNVKTLSSN